LGSATSNAPVAAAPHPLHLLGLEVTHHVSDADVRRAYKALALTCHPDKIGQSSVTVEGLMGSSGSGTQLSASFNVLLQQRGHLAFCRLSEAFSLVKDETQRRLLVEQHQRRIREQELKEQIHRAKEQEEKERAECQRKEDSRRARGSVRGRVAGKSALARENNLHFDHGPPTTGIRLRSSSLASCAGAFKHSTSFRPRSVHRSAMHTSTNTSTSTSTNASMTAQPGGLSKPSPTASSAVRAAARRASSAASASIDTACIPVSDSTRLQDQLRKWKLFFAQEMRREFDRDLQSFIQQKVGGENAPGNLDSNDIDTVRVGQRQVAQRVRVGVDLFGRRRTPGPTHNSNTHTHAYVQAASERKEAVPTSTSSSHSSSSSSSSSGAATPSHLPPSPVVATSSLSRMQQMRARQAGGRAFQAMPLPAATGATATTSTHPSPSNPSTPSPLNFPSAATMSMLQQGERFRVQTHALPAKFLASSKSAYTTDSPPPSHSAHDYLSLWLDSSGKSLLYRLSSSKHSHPDGFIPIEHLVAVTEEEKRSIKTVAARGSTTTSTATSKHTNWIILHLQPPSGRSMHMAIQADDANTSNRWLNALQQLVAASSNV